ncbi:copper resistance D family protein [Cytobacillus firmus]|uniref:Copper resistance protein D domain-containing protein n=1 Tax=Cytobacillus firmus DS1 TaxID=1307436 RepID=W7KMB6_CYTFI|nr:CopD family protein [Cytobacillus firmus]EWG08550.1 hypothetical protein PBF_23670 [Cytobacillus firmus DS1]MBG9549690.1 copper resistance protein CopD [Cytobacillus firmus]MBG9604056.1 copper resistance protein CopD [Cytobacillus firmus]MED1942732.1 CopD family protein [Cytobacillus firmus]
MIITGIFTETFLYLCFSLLIGAFLLSLVPFQSKPDIKVPKGVLMAATGGIAVFSFVPVLQLILYLYQDVGLGQTFQSVIFTFEVGKAWVVTYLLSNLLFIYIIWFDYRSKRFYALVGVFITFIMILALGWSSHASSLDQWKGFIAHSVHFTAVSIWIGVLITVSWFSKNSHNWLNFLKWFTPVALMCLMITIGTGLVLMAFVVDFKDYANSWMVPYGQALLIKHLLILPLVVYAGVNSVLIKRKLKTDAEFNPVPWTRIESAVILLIFAATAALGQQSPPHDIEMTVKSGVSKLFAMFYQGQIDSALPVQMTVNITGISLGVVAFLFLALTVLSYIKRSSAALSFLMSILFVVSTYLSLLLSIK